MFVPLLHLDAGVPVLSERLVGEVVQQAELWGCSAGGSDGEKTATSPASPAAPEHPGMEMMHRDKKEDEVRLTSLQVTPTTATGAWADCEIKKVVEQRLVLVVGEQVELIQDEQHRAAAAAITWRKEAGFWLQTLTIVFPDPLGPTISTELLSPWTAVRFSSSRRSLNTLYF
ncbi:hypothetical protein F7725_009267 [Dissostichus mawsoni]|uniref:Uncharacterized protein n=1 Tax=Dissostichus mawsoni TaxID=36200 RepID=A0A7J5ZAN2_DISMA|nr:hypothetical protein F7725_009267 [Dissostichus mawsoni]